MSNKVVEPSTAAWTYSGGNQAGIRVGSGRKLTAHINRAATGTDVVNIQIKQDVLFEDYYKDGSQVQLTKTNNLEVFDGPITVRFTKVGTADALALFLDIA